MKVGRVGSGTTARVGGARRAATQQSESFRVGAPEASEAPAPLTGASGLAPVSALLAIQETGDATSERARAVQRGEDLLSRLERIRLALIDGRLPPVQLKGLMQALDRQGTAFRDPQLNEILEEIEVRAAVELAKLEMSTPDARDTA